MKKIKNLLVSLVCISLFFTLASGVKAQNWTSEQMEVFKVAEKLNSAWANRDLEGFMGCLHEDAIVWFNHKPHPTDKNGLRYWNEYWFKTEKVLRYQLTPLTINIFGDTAISNAHISMLIETKTGQVQRYTRWTNVYKKINGKWLILGWSGGEVK